MSVVQAADGGYVVAGASNSAGTAGYDVYIVKTNSTGTLSLSTTSSRAGDDFAYSIDRTSDGGYIVTGVYDATQPDPDPLIIADRPGQLFLRKLDASLLVVWQATPASATNPNSAGFSVRETADGGFIVAGAWNVNLGGGGAYLLKTDASGAKQWEAYLPGKYAADVQQAPDGGYVVGLHGPVLVSPGISARGALLKTDSTGNVEWMQAGDGSGTARGVANVAAGGYAVAGETIATDPVADLYVARTAGDGTVQWLRVAAASGGDIGHSIVQASDLGFVVVGQGSSVPNHRFDVSLSKTDAAGVLEWQRYFGGTGDDVGRSVRRTADGGYVIAGYTTSSPAQATDVYLVKTDANGTSQW